MSNQQSSSSSSSGCSEASSFLTFVTCHVKFWSWRFYPIHNRAHIVAYNNSNQLQRMVITYHFSVPSNLISGMQTIFLFKYNDEIFSNDSLYVFSMADRFMVNCRISSSNSHSCWFLSWSLATCSACKPFKYLPWLPYSTLDGDENKEEESKKFSKLESISLCTLHSSTLNTSFIHVYRDLSNGVLETSFFIFLWEEKGNETLQIGKKEIKWVKSKSRGCSGIFL